MHELDVTRPDGTVLHVYDTEPQGPPGLLTVFWHHGTPNIGTPPAPLFAQSRRLGIRWVSHDRPAYGGSTPRAGRDVASVAADVALVADALGIATFAVMGHSGGGPHALACGALLGNRVEAAVSVSGLAPLDTEGFDPYAGMAAGGVANLRAAGAGRAALTAAHEASEDDPEMFTARDVAAFDGPWGWFGSVVGPALAGGPEGMIEDDLAYAAPWGFDPADVDVPTLLLHGGQDRVAPVTHARWLAGRLPDAELRVHDEDGHISVLTHADAALDWLRERS